MGAQNLAEIARPDNAKPVSRGGLRELDNAAPDEPDLVISRVLTDINCRNQKVPGLRNGLITLRPKKSNLLNDKRNKSFLSRFDSGAYSRLQFLRAVSHSVGTHTESLQPRDDSSSSSSDDEDEASQAPVPAATTSTTAIKCVSHEAFALQCFVDTQDFMNNAHR